MTIPSIFDRNARRRRTRRAAGAAPDDAWLIARASEDIVARLSAIRRDLATILVMTPRPDLICDQLPNAARIIWPGAAMFDEDRLPFADRSVDAIISIGLLDTVNDLPGALTLFRRALTDDGVMLAALAGAGSLPRLRQALAGCDPGRAHCHPQIDVRAMGDLLLRTGYAQPVVDADSVDARYRGLERLTRDLRANGQTNVLTGRVALPRSAVQALRSALECDMIEGRFIETFVTLHATGWASPAR